MLPLLVAKPGQTQKRNSYWLGPPPQVPGRKRERASKCITDSNDIWLRSWKNILQLENLSNSTSLHTILPTSQRINVYSNTWIPGDVFLPLAVAKWLLRFLGPFGMFLTPTAQNFQVSWKQATIACTDRISPHPWNHKHITLSLGFQEGCLSWLESDRPVKYHF